MYYSFNLQIENNRHYKSKYCIFIAYKCRYIHLYISLINYKCKQVKIHTPIHLAKCIIKYSCVGMYVVIKTQHINVKYNNIKY